VARPWNGHDDGRGGMLAFTVGLTSTALAGTDVGARFDLGKTNAVNQVSKLIGTVAGPSLTIDNNSANGAATALNLQVETSKAPMKVNSGAKVANLNADKVDGKSVGEIGVNGLAPVAARSASDSSSPKVRDVSCQTGKVVVGTGYDIAGAKSVSIPDQQADVVVERIQTFGTFVVVEAYEEELTSADWSMSAWAICATAP
jgi:hypothetical protein